MSTESIHETCACGARFDWRGDSIFAERRVVAWRETHHHREPSVGMCGDPQRIEGPEPRTTHCTLRAGHAGWHEDGQGSSWGRLRWVAAATCCTPTTPKEDA